MKYAELIIFSSIISNFADASPVTAETLAPHQRPADVVPLVALIESPLPDSVFTANISFYQPRVDSVVVDKRTLPLLSWTMLGKLGDPLPVISTAKA